MKQIIQNISPLLKEVHKKGFFHLFSANILIQVFAFASQLFVAGILLPDDLGRIKIIQTFLSIFSIIAMMGFNSSTLKLCSENHFTDSQRNRIFKSGLLFTLLSSVSVYIIILILNLFNLFSSDTYIQYLIPIGLFPVISNSLFQIYVSYTQAIKQIKLMSRLTISNKLISIIGIIILTYLFGINGYYIAYNLSFILMLIVCIYVFHRYLNLNLSSHSISKKIFRTHWQYARPSLFSNLFAEVSVYVDIILISLFFPKENMTDIGFYSFALTLTVILRLFPSTVQQISLPYFSSFSHDRETFMQIYKKYNRILYLAVVITLIAAVTVIPLFLHWVFAGKYILSIQYFLPMAFGWSIRQLTQLQSSAIFGLGKIEYTAYNNIISIFVNTLLFIIAIHFWGLLGAAYVSIISNTIYFLISRIFFKKALQQI